MVYAEIRMNKKEKEAYKPKNKLVVKSRLGPVTKCGTSAPVTDY